MSPEPTEIPQHRHAEAADRLRRAALEGPGHTEPALRQAIADYSSELWTSGRTAVEIPRELRPYVGKVARAAYKIVDEDTDALKAAGYSEDQIFEITTAAAVGCGIRALEVGLTVTREED